MCHINHIISVEGKDLYNSIQNKILKCIEFEGLSIKKMKKLDRRRKLLIQQYLADIILTTFLLISISHFVAVGAFQHTNEDDTNNKMHDLSKKIISSFIFHTHILEMITWHN